MRELYILIEEQHLKTRTMLCPYCAADIPDMESEDGDLVHYIGKNGWHCRASHFRNEYLDMFCKFKGDQ